MIGFGCGKVEVENWLVIVEMKFVNYCFCEIVICMLR